MWPFETDNSIALFRGDTKTNQVAEKVPHERRKWMWIACRSATETQIDKKPYSISISLHLKAYTCFSFRRSISSVLFKSESIIPTADWML